MPRIDHTALYVTDLDTSRDFFTTYVGAASNDGYHNPRSGLRTYFLTFDDGSRLEIMARPGIEAERVEGQLGWAHVALNLGSREAVDALAERLTADGYRVVNGPRVTGDGCYEAVVLDEAGNEIELVG